MCGIAGFLDTRPGPDEAAALARMLAAIAHRGPDASGDLIEAPAFLGHLRLSIVDVSDAGAQPLYNEDGSLAIFYNGEIFNHADLRPELERRGHRYRGRSDTETVLHAWEEYGPDCLHRFRGMFAFAIWDRRRGALFLARDRLGIKPLYYFSNGRLFAFASEIKALLAHPSISAALDESALSESLAFGYTAGDRTLFAGIRKLMPGCRLSARVSDGAVEFDVERWWDLPSPVAPERRGEEDWIADCRARLEETVRMRLMSDVPLGVFLSGGVDSSAITALMTRMVPEPVKTFSVGYRETSFNELPAAHRVATTLATDHHTVTIGLEDFFNALPAAIWHEDEPLAWPSSVALYFVARLAARHVKVVLTGEGADELFGGYARYRSYPLQANWLPAWRLVPSALRRGVRRAIESSSLLRADLRRKLGHTFLGRDETLESLYLDNFYCAFPAAELDTLVARSGSDQYAGFHAAWNPAALSGLDRMLRADQKTYLVELLMKQDQMSMAASIESRVPLLDHTLVEFAARVPDHLRIRGAGKYIFKKAVEDLLPRGIVWGAKKGFPTPLRMWLGDRRALPLVASIGAGGGWLSEYLRPEALTDLVIRHQEGSLDATDRLWRLVNLQIWGDIFLTGRRRPADSLLDSNSTPALV